MAPTPDSPAGESATTLGELAILFLRLGLTAFGGPAAHIAIMEDEVVVRRQWLSREKFLDLLGAANLIPGPTSTELAIYIGYLRRGLAGLLLAGLCFILPAAVLVGAIAWAYVRFGALPEVAGILYGVKPVVIAVVVQVIWRLGRKAIKTAFLAGAAVAATVAGLLGVNELLLLVGAGVVVAAVSEINRRRSKKPSSPLPLPMLLLGTVGPTTQAGAAGLAAAGAVGLWPLFLVFLKVGAVLFGSGYVLLAFLRADLVERRHWMTESQLLDAIAVGQVTPGPVFTTATFIGYLLAGPAGAVVATVAIFLPSFVYVGITSPLVPRIRKSLTAGAFLDGVNVGALALMAVVTWNLGRAAVVDIPTAALLLGSLALLWRWRINTSWLVLAGAAFGLAKVLAMGKLA